MNEIQYDAIVIGSGISGGWAAKELCEQGMKTLVLERGRNIEHLKDYPTWSKNPWEFPHGGRVPKEYIDKNPITSKAAGFGEDTLHFFIEDAIQPYVQKKPFDWIRGYQVGGKSLIWGRACQRWSDYEFKAPSNLGYGEGWPIGYKDIAPWYSHVERFIGVCGNTDGIEAMPDGEFLPPFELNCVERHLQKVLSDKFPGRHLVQGRWAQVTQPQEIHLQQGRGKCQCRNLCMRGCPYGGYFSSVTSTLPWANKTGRLTIRPYSVVHSIIYDEDKGKATGVRVIDAESKEEIIYNSRVIFVNASALNTNLILLNSKSNRFPNGLGNDNGLLGKYIGFHLYRGWANGKINGFEDKYVYGKNPTECIIANYRNLGKLDTDFFGGYTIFSGGYRVRREPETIAGPRLGGSFKDQLSEAGQWYIYMYMQGETLPKETNRIYLSETEKDPFGIPQLVTDVGYDENDEKMIRDFLTESRLMLEAAGCTEIETIDNHQAPGLDIHEMGGVRMGVDPESSLLNKNNQLHSCPNVFVTDGACMTSTGNQSPSLLYMALTARAAAFAAEQIRNKKL
ncbi:GMC oxidoreductase [Robiginitalea sp. IMCC44478]|uniref:GMC oxidoreductase n=1 Tax=Robiginitalea sp. IMCC44478 TaxID=3459122 RepID=UPI004042E724